MRRTPLLLGAALFLAACDGVEVSSGAPSTTEVGSTTDPIVGTKGTNNFGTQVGSEGFWGCSVQSRLSLAATEDVPGFGVSAEDLAADRLGTWPVDLLPEDTQALEAGVLELGPAVAYTLVTLEGGCEPYLEVELRGTLARGSNAAVDMRGLLATNDTEAGLRMVAPSVDDDAVLSWGPPPTSGTAWLRVDADLDAFDLQGDVAWADCVETTCANVAPLGTLEGSR